MDGLGSLKYNIGIVEFSNRTTRVHTKCFTVVHPQSISGSIGDVGSWHQFLSKGAGSYSSDISRTCHIYKPFGHGYLLRDYGVWRLCVCSSFILQSENPSALLLKQMLMALSFPKPPDGITPFVLFSKIETKVRITFCNFEFAHIESND